MNASSGPALNARNLPRADVERVGVPGYDRDQVGIGVLHLGPGAFHRAHQADFFDRLLARDPRWGVCGVSLRSAAVSKALSPQDGLYTLAILDETVRYRIIGALKEVMTADDARFRERFAAPQTRLVTLTITEKGYCLGADGALDLTHADMRHDVENPRRPKSAIGWIVEGLRPRRAAGLAAPDIVSCDNLSDNGDKLRRAVLALAREVDPDLAQWIEGEARFPRTMVDAITPATDEALRAAVREATGFDDAWPVRREAFSSWVIEDNVSPSFPDLSSVGAVMASDVAAHERAKLRMLNGAHSTLAYCGLAKGYETVAEAMGDAALSSFIDDMMRVEIAPGLAAPRGLDLDDYRRALMKRFRNPAIAHRLSQIAWDGSQKLPIRLLETIADNLKAGRPVARLSTGVAAWMRFMRRAARTGADIVDPLKDRLLKIGAACRDEAAHDGALFRREAGMFPPSLAVAESFRAALEAGYRQVMDYEKQSASAAS